jgi:hypothetical protein
MEILLEKLLPALHRAVRLAENQNLLIDKSPEHGSSGIATIESLELQRQELIQKKQSLIDQINKLIKETEASHEQFIEQINELG